LLAFLSGGYLFRVKPGNQFYYDRMAQFIQDSEGSDIFFGAEVTRVVLSHGSVSALFTTPDGKHHVAHAPRLLWAIPPTAENRALVVGMPSEVEDAYAGLTSLPYFYAQRFQEVSNPYGIPILSMTNESDSVKQAALQGLLTLVGTSEDGVWAGSSWTNLATDGPAEVSARTHTQLVQIASMTLVPNVSLGLVLTLVEQWWHESYGVRWNTSAIQADSYAAVEDQICPMDALVVFIGGFVGHYDSALLNEQAERTMRKCGLIGGRRKLAARRDEVEFEFQVPALPADVSAMLAAVRATVQGCKLTG
jgi:hypothetical protein